MAEEIKVTIGADAAPFNAELVKAQNELRSFQAALKKTTDVKELEALNNKIKETQKTIGGLTNTLAKDLKTGSNKASQSLLDLSRIAQDAPYGFIGISNNISPLIESFGRLKEESGSVGGALKALLGGLSGPAGLGIAFAAITSAITFAQIGFQAWTGSTKSAKDETKNFDDKLKQLQIELKYVTEDLDKFISVSDTASKLNDINIQARFSDDITQNKLSRQAKFISISEELVTATDARSKAWKNYIEISSSAFKSDEDYESARKSALDVYNETIKKENELIDARELQAATNRLATVEEQRAAAEKLKSIETIDSVIAQMNESLKDQRALSLTFNKSTLQEQFNIVESTITKLVKDFNLSPDSKTIIKLKFGEFGINELNTLFGRKFQLDLENRVNTIQPIGISSKIKPIDTSKLITPNSIIQAKKYLDDLAKQAADYAAKKAADFQAIVMQFSSDSAAQIGALLGEGLAAAITGQSDGLLSAFQGLFSLFGDAVINLGKYAIMYSSGMEALKKAIAGASGLTGIGIGIGLIALGTLIKKATAGIGKNAAFAVGTRNAPGGMALVGERGPELVNLPKGSQVIPAAQTSNMMGAMQSIEVYGMLKGKDIYFSNKNYSKTYQTTT